MVVFEIMVVVVDVRDVSRWSKNGVRLCDRVVVVVVVVVVDVVVNKRDVSRWSKWIR